MTYLAIAASIVLAFAFGLRIPTLSGQVFQLEAGHRSDVKPATIPINVRPL
ncbi:hypothetical protein [Mesorhizobium sp. CN2-181]|uniref:hypothetical protein n=1 Tax=Mesorhizobium yinganensis TaxID=3157707 RepID=UPI0032B82956